MNVFDPNVHLKMVTIVGVGGTGAQVARMVGRMLFDMRRAGRHIPQLVLIDPDVVDESNVGRQLFSPSVLGMNKAEVVGQMLNMALGLEVKWIPDGVDAVRHFDRYGGNLIISCVDNHEARQEIHRVDGVLLAAGNHVDAGQVCVGNTADIELMRRFIDGRDGKYSYLPKEGLLFPELLQAETPLERPTPEAEASCGELIASGDQHLLINDTIAAVVGMYAYQLLHRLPLYTFLSQIRVGDAPVVRSLPITREELEVFLGRG